MISLHIAAFAALALPLFTVATPTELKARQGSDDGSVECCGELMDPTSPQGVALLEHLDIDLGDVSGSIGLDCHPISVIGGLVNACSLGFVDCVGNINVGGLISIGCIPIML
ncbi:hypothetical protein ONZ51_g10052 [Trametes cubensis]|uniref:Hydrophobin n=1 Tax=Trametes cubensis TaxID=1111947 RepID=A0AAD7TKQ1_9APHY|nr:hypothetical protein ONZ51_g10052 [Trametes cubensis]